MSTNISTPLVQGRQVNSQSQLFFWALPGRFDRALKRALDICASLLGLIVLSPFFLIIAVLIKRDSAGPVFYRGRRVGRNGQEFRILKFRTMVEEPRSYQGPKVTAQDDPRVTPLGHWLRNTKLNELPQLWNVLIGEMSLVGPRPEDPEIVATWLEPVRRQVLSVRPGITSPASVLFRNEETMLNPGRVMQSYLESILPNKLRLDQLYVRHRSFLLDLDVLVWTLLVLLPRLKKVAPPEELLYLGPLRQFVRRYLNWFVVDTFITLGAIASAGVILRLFGPLDIGLPNAIVVALGFSVLYGVTSAVLGMYRVAWSHANSVDALGLLAASFIAAVFALWINQNVSEYSTLRPSLIILASIFAFAGFVVARYRSRLFSGFAIRWLETRATAQAAKERVLIVGGGYMGQFMAWLMSNGLNESGFHVIGFIDDDLYKRGVRFDGHSVLGDRADIPRLVEKHDVGLIVFAIHNISAAERSRLIEICAGTSARVVTVPDILGALNGILANYREGESNGNGSHSRLDSGDMDACEFCLFRGLSKKLSEDSPQRHEGAQI